MNAWAWTGVLLASPILLLFVALRSYRRGVRRQAVQLLRDEHPEVQVVRETAAAIQVRFPDGSSGTLGLANLYQSVARERGEAAQRETVRRFVTSAMASARDAVRPLSLATDGDRLMPRLAAAAFARQAASGGTPLLERETPVPGLLVLYVLDGDDAVRYLGQAQLAELGIDLEALHRRAMANLARHPITEIVRDVVERRNVAVVKLGGSLDATRLLLVPEAMKDGEELVAVVPDRETLALMPVPAEDGWGAVQKLARTPASPYLLLDRPLRVTRAGFAAA